MKTKDSTGLGSALKRMIGSDVWWPPNHGDPSVKGPKPRIISAEAAEALFKMQEEKGNDEFPSVVHQDER